MTMIGNWVKKVFGAIMPTQEGNAWDALKRVRALELQRTQELEAKATYSREDRIRVRRYQ